MRNEIDVNEVSKAIDICSEKTITLINGLGEIIDNVKINDTTKRFIGEVDSAISDLLTKIIYGYSGLALTNKNIKISDIPNQIDIDNSPELAVIVDHPNTFDTMVHIYSFQDADKREDVKLNLLHKISLSSKDVTVQDIKYELGIFVDKFLIPKYEFDGE